LKVLIVGNGITPKMRLAWMNLPLDTPWLYNIGEEARCTLQDSPSIIVPARAKAVIIVSLAPLNKPAELQLALNTIRVNKPLILWVPKDVVISTTKVSHSKVSNTASILYYDPTDGGSLIQLAEETLAILSSPILPKSPLKKYIQSRSSWILDYLTRRKKSEPPTDN